MEGTNIFHAHPFIPMRTIMYMTNKKSSLSPTASQLFRFAFIYMHVTLWHAREIESEKYFRFKHTTYADEVKYMIPNNGEISKNVYGSRREDRVF